MNDQPLLTAEEFAAREPDDDLAQRRMELVAGRLVPQEPPDTLHGTFVLNLTKALAQHLQRSPDEPGYACFEIGLIVARNPDTVRRPPVAFFVGGERFAELDRPMTVTRPALVVEIASTNERRRLMRERVESYLNWGIHTVWVADTAERAVHLVEQGRPTRIFGGEQSVPGGRAIGDFRVRVRDLFEEPR